MFSFDTLARLFPAARPGAIDGLVAAQDGWRRAGLFKTANRFRYLLAQIAHESAGLTILEENLSYTAKRLTAVWPRRFPTLADAQPFARNPRALANRVYGGRMGNDGPDDGWTFRGRGFIQITGKDAYAAVGDLAGLDLISHPDHAADPAHAGEIVAAFVRWKDLNPAADAGDFSAHTRLVNGGQNGLADRRAWLRKVEAAFPLQTAQA